jgi:hypothetical protein
MLVGFESSFFGSKRFSRKNILLQITESIINNSSKQTANKGLKNSKKLSRPNDMI